MNRFMLHAPLWRRGDYIPQDVHDLKVALNHLGYFRPDPRTGIEEGREAALFEVLGRFQKDRNIPQTDYIIPFDETMRTLNADISRIEGTRRYIWRTAGDTRVRDDHAAREERVFTFGAPPPGGHPGEDYNCRCWAEVVEESTGPAAQLAQSQPAQEQATGLKQELISNIVDEPNKWSTTDFKLHFMFGAGREITLSEAGYLDKVITKAKEIMYKKVEDQVADRMQKIQTGLLIYTTKASYPFGDVHPYFGGGTIQTSTEGAVVKEGNLLNLRAVVTYVYTDVFTDPFSIREQKYGTSSPDGISFLELKITDRGGTYFTISDTWKTRMTGTININSNN